MNKKILKIALLMIFNVNSNKPSDFTRKDFILWSLCAVLMVKLFHSDSIQKETQSLINQNYKETQSLINQNYMELKTLITLSQHTIIQNINETFYNLNELRNTFNENQITLQKKYNVLAELINTITAGTAQESMKSYQNLLQTQTQNQERLTTALNECNKKLQHYEESFKKLNIHVLMDQLNIMKNDINSLKAKISTIKTDIQNNFNYQMSILKTEVEKEINNKNTYTCNFTKQITQENTLIIEKNIEKKIKELNTIFSNSIDKLLLDMEKKLINQEKAIKEYIEKNAEIIKKLPNAPAPPHASVG